jgi:hypothetical protein
MDAPPDHIHGAIAEALNEERRARALPVRLPPRFAEKPNPIAAFHTCPHSRQATVEIRAIHIRQFRCRKCTFLRSFVPRKREKRAETLIVINTYSVREHAEDSGAPLRGAPVDT